MCYLDTNLRYRFNNNAYLKWFGYSPKELYGKSVKEIFGESGLI